MKYLKAKFNFEHSKFKPDFYPYLPYHHHKRENMATFSTRSFAPNVLIVSGSDITRGGSADLGTVRGLLTNFLYDPATDAPVRRGTHDFWIFYSIPELETPLYCCADASVSPTMYRGFINMGRVPADISEAILQEHLSTLTQEVFHYWLVPGDISFDIDGSEVPVLNGWRLTDAVNNGRALTSPPLLARDQSHWSCYWQADGSPMDGINFRQIGEENGFPIWRPAPLAGFEITPDGLPPVLLTHQLNDLDLWLMGLKNAETAYRERDNQIQWIDPQLVAPLEYSAGIYLAASRNDHVQFGFYGDHRQLALTRTGQEPEIVGLDDSYDHLGNEWSGVALRVVRRGNEYFFQAKYHNPLEGCGRAILRRLGLPVRGRTVNIFDGVENPLPPDPSNFNFSTWQTVFQKTYLDQFVTTGQYVKKWLKPHYVEVSFFNLSIKTSETERHFPLRPIPPRWLEDYDSLPENTLIYEQPRDGVIVRNYRGQMIIALPFSEARASGELFHFADDEFDHNATIDRCPKTVLRVPRGDFSAATWAKINKTTITPWAGGYAWNKTFWVKLNHLNTNQINIPRHSIDKWATHPSDGIFKSAYIILAERESDISDEVVQRVDAIRKYFDLTFHELTQRRFSMNSRL